MKRLLLLALFLAAGCTTPAPLGCFCNPTKCQCNHCQDKADGKCACKVPREPTK